MSVFQLCLCLVSLWLLLVQVFCISTRILKSIQQFLPKKKKCETASWDFGWSTQNPQIARGVKQRLNNMEPRPPSGRSAPVWPLGPRPVTAGLGGPTD